jgi:hypothetical protein
LLVAGMSRHTLKPGRLATPTAGVPALQLLVLVLELVVVALLLEQAAATSVKTAAPASDAVSLPIDFTRYSPSLGAVGIGDDALVKGLGVPFNAK